MKDSMEVHVVNRYIRREFYTVVAVLASDDDLRRSLFAKVSCSMPQRGTHIDSLPIEPAIPPADYRTAVQQTEVQPR